MRSLLVSLFLLCPVFAGAATPEDAYFAARDAAISHLSALSDNSADQSNATTEYDKAADDLARLLRPLIGGVKVKGFGGEGKLNIGSLLKGDEDFGTLDGLLFEGVGNEGSLIVTTKSIFQHWLVEHKEWWGQGAGQMPQTLQNALQIDDFYTQAIISGAAYSRISQLALSPPSGAEFVIALLGARTQDLKPDAPSQLNVAVIVGERVLIAEVPLQVAIPPVPACTRIMRAAQPKIDAADKAFADSGRKNAALASKLAKLQQDADTAFGSCFLSHVKNTKPFASAQAQAEDLVGAMVGR